MEKESYIDMPPNKTFIDLGLDQFGQAPLKFSGPEINKKAETKGEAGTPPNLIQAGNLTQQFTMTDGWIQSSNFVTGVSGWRLNADGTSEFN